LRPALGGGYAPGQKIRLQTHTASPLQIFIDANERESGPEAILFCNRCPVAKLLIGSPALGHIFSLLPDYISQVHSDLGTIIAGGLARGSDPALRPVIKDFCAFVGNVKEHPPAVAPIVGSLESIGGRAGNYGQSGFPEDSLGAPHMDVAGQQEIRARDVV
jgi:hypothetical protein